MLIVAFDPGISTGWALMKDGKLHDMGFLTERTWSTVRYANFCFIEDVWWRGREKNPQSLLTLAKNAGTLGGIYKALNPQGVVRYLFPHEYKRSLDKPMAHARAKRQLEADEIKIWQSWEGKPQDVLDAGVLGLYAVGRRVFQ